jgi:hypothetical protein
MTTSSSGDGQYGDPPSKYETRRMYDSIHYGMGSMTAALTFEAIQANKGHDPKARDRGRRLHKQQDDQRPRGGYQLPYNAPGRPGDDDEGHGEITLRRMVGKPSPCLQCHHGRYSSTTPHHAATWAQDHDDNHARTCTTPRQDSVTCKPS